MRRLISFLLLATAAAGPLAAQDREPQDQRTPRGDRGDQRGDRGAQRGDQGAQSSGPRRDYRAANPPAAAPAVQAQPAQQGRWAGRDYRQVQGQMQGQSGRVDPGQARDARADPRGYDRNDPRDNAARNDPRYQNRGNDNRGNNDRGNNDRDYGRNDGRRGYDPGQANRSGNGNGYGEWRGNDRGQNGNRQLGWSNQWRNDRRYDWQGYRSANRNLFRAPRYYGPRGYEYSRWSRGYRVQPFFYGNSYWINDPWRYRLPPADGYYRWVRYYDDVALIDIRTGLIEDIIYSFFYR